MADGIDADASAGRTHSVRVNVSAPAELLEQLRAANPDFSPSELFQRALRDAIGCVHDELACTHCGARVRRLDVAQAALGRFYVDAVAAAAQQARRGGTAEGLLRVLRELGRRHGIRHAELSTPGLTRTERSRAKIKELPERPPTVTPAAATLAVDEAG